MLHVLTLLSTRSHSGSPAWSSFYSWANWDLKGLGSLLTSAMVSGWQLVCKTQEFSFFVVCLGSWQSLSQEEKVKWETKWWEATGYYRGCGGNRTEKKTSWRRARVCTYSERLTWLGSNLCVKIHPLCKIVFYSTVLKYLSLRLFSFCTSSLKGFPVVFHVHSAFLRQENTQPAFALVFLSSVEGT